MHLDTRIQSDATELKSIVDNLQKKIEENESVITNTKEFLQKAQIMHEQITDSFISAAEAIDHMKSQQTSIHTME